MIETDQVERVRPPLNKMFVSCPAGDQNDGLSGGRENDIVISLIFPLYRNDRENIRKKMTSLENVKQYITQSAHKSSPGRWTGKHLF